MIKPLKNLVWSRLVQAGVDVRRASKRTGVDALVDLEKLCGPGTVQTIFDVGANVGQSASRFQAAFPAAAIHCFEPVQASYELGRAATAGHPSVTWHRVAVGAAARSTIIYSDGVSQLASLATEKAPDPTRNLTVPNEVTVIRLDEFCREHDIPRIDLLKTDTEGFDLDVLRGAEPLFISGRIRCVICEVGFAAADTGHSYFPPIAAFLESLGWRLFHFYAMSEKEHFDHWGVCYADALFAKPPAGNGSSV